MIDKNEPCMLKQAMIGTLALSMSLSAAVLGCAALAAPVDSAAAIPNSAPSASTTALQGQVQVTAKTALLGIKSAGEAAGELKRSATKLFWECSRHDQQIMDEPEMIGGTIIEIPISFDLGPCLPPRKKWVDAYMNQIDQFEQVLTGEMEGIVAPDSKTPEIGAVLTSMNDYLQDTQQRITDLKQLTQGPVYDGNAIGQQCKLISDDMKKFDDLHKKAFHLVKEQS